ncbi:NAD(P)-binding protein [Tilletiaria anomala UBC 951]|uniref:NAD(P)-binding protein n=1 Tax=Tilletiaria anomala (strain ATCC 24038 / CBS 436.72 / UBC 951) TaxID=1037660 RepID=A0A066VRI6_TILAU|nr:NAD(P)-binding protein [Tilletiaria anomala UBC 951]KDN44106.1 NAD(P)-binding protein [Tilletiaria anomala UBC 951]
MPTPIGKLWQASSIAEPFQQAVKDSIAMRVSAGKRRPKLVGILATRSEPSIAYAEWTRKACDSVGIDFAIWKTWEDSGKGEEVDGAEVKSRDLQDLSLEADVEDLIIAANADSNVNGIMVYYPIFGGRRDTYLQQIVDPRKDVEGLHFSYCWNMYHNVRWLLPSQVGRAPGTYTELDAAVPATASKIADEVPKGFAKSILPCTPLAVVKCMEAMGIYDFSLPYGDRLYGKTVTVINRSEVVGRPLAALLANDGARVFSIDIDSIQEFNKRPDSEPKTHTASAIVLAAREHNAARRLRPHHIVRMCSLTAEECIGRSDVVIGGVPSASYKVRTEWIKEGATCINFSSEKNFEKDVRTRAAQYLPAIGKTTIAMLQRNLVRLLEYRDVLSQ